MADGVGDNASVALGFTKLWGVLQNQGAAILRQEFSLTLALLHFDPY